MTDREPSLLDFREIMAMGYGPKPREGDVVAVYAGHGDHFIVRAEQKLDVPQDKLLLYRVTEVLKPDRGWARDRFKCKAVLDDELFEVAEDMSISRKAEAAS